MKKFILMLFICFGVAVTAFAYERLNFNNDFISDNAGLINNLHYSRINKILIELQNKTKADIAVVTVNSLNGETIEDTAVKIGRDYKVGSKEKNNGIVFLVAPNEREARIEVGYGLEDVITDEVAQDIMDEVIIPEFKINNYSGGIYKGVVSLANAVAKADNVTLESTNGVSDANQPRKYNPIETFVLGILVILGMIFGRGGRGRGRFGGGGFRGGRGATGRW